MFLQDMFKKTTYITVDTSEKQRPYRDDLEEINEPSVPEGLWIKCKSCGELIYSEDLEENHRICPKCNYYFHIGARERIAMILDEGTFEEWDNTLPVENPLDFPNYKEKVIELKEKTQLDEAVITGKGMLSAREVVIAICDTNFLMGSMGHTVGEKITRAIEKATAMQLPLIIFTCSGGARMQEGMVSLMQMAKTSAAIKRHSDAGLLYITVLTDPTTGGVTASFGMLGDIILAEPGALIGFAGPRVIKETIGQDLPSGFQRSEFLLEHGMIDSIVTRDNLKRVLARILRIHMIPQKKSIESFYQKIEKEAHTIISMDNRKEKKEQKENLAAWDRVKIARMSKRPTTRDYIKILFKHFYELHGDRYFGEDGSIIGGIGMFGRQPVTVIGQQKGRSTKENIKRNFGMPSPEGYRKALRLMKQAEKFNRPIICFVDTPGAFCGIEAEQRGQGEAIARNLMELSGIRVPILSIVIGEGGSGGALALAMANEVWMMENSMYSVLSPEGFAAILWKDGKRAKEAADVMKITAKDLKRLGIIEHIIPEKEIATEQNLPVIAAELKLGIIDFFKKYTAKSKEELVNQRYERYRKI